MINLLSPIEKKALRREYLLRVAVTGMWLIAVSIAIGAFLLVPSFILTHQQVQEMDTKEDALRMSSSSIQAGVYEKEVTAAKDEIADIRSHLDEVSIVSLLGVLIKKRPTGITITSFQYRKNQGDGTRQIIIQGVAAKRDTLVAYSHQLEEEQRFASVDLPIADLAKNEDVAFTMTLPLTTTP